MVSSLNQLDVAGCFKKLIIGEKVETCFECKVLTLADLGV